MTAKEYGDIYVSVMGTFTGQLKESFKNIKNYWYPKEVAVEHDCPSSGGLRSVTI